MYAYFLDKLTNWPVSGQMATKQYWFIPTYCKELFCETMPQEKKVDMLFKSSHSIQRVFMFHMHFY